MGSFFAPETDMIFGDGVGASLVRGPYCQLDVGLCDVDVFLHWNSAAEEGAWVGLKPDLQGGTKGPFFVILFCSNFHSLEALKACREACPDVFCSNFHGLATLEFKTCIEACLQLCFIL